MYSQEERTRLTGEINDMAAFIPGAYKRYFRRSLHVKNCRDRLIISSGKGGCPLIRACSVITSNTVCSSLMKIFIAITLEIKTVILYQM